MAIRTLVTRGFGNETFAGSINLLPTRGYSIAALFALDSTKYLDLIVLDSLKYVCVLDAKTNVIVPDLDTETVI